MVSCRCTPTGSDCGSLDFLTDEPFDLTLHGFGSAKLLFAQPLEDVRIGFVIKLQLYLGRVYFVIPVLLVNPELLFPCFFLLHCVIPPPGFNCIYPGA